MRSLVKAGGGEERNVVRHRVRSPSRQRDRTRSISASIASRSNDGLGMAVRQPCVLTLSLRRDIVRYDAVGALFAWLL
jgi:hypothetical protein